MRVQPHARAGRTNVWIMRLDEENVSDPLLRQPKCNGCSIDSSANHRHIGRTIYSYRFPW
jgi:hypothetical protein